MVKKTSPFMPPKAPAILYRAELSKLIDAMSKDYRSVLGIYKQKQDQVAMDAKGTWLTTEMTEKLEKLGARWSKRFSEFAYAHSKQFVKKLLRMSNTQIKSVLKDWFADKRLELFGQVIPNDIKQVMNADIAYNVSLIKSIQVQYHDRVLGAVMRSITGAGSLKQLTIEIDRYKREGMRRAKLIAVDQTRKVYTNITLHSCQRLGIKKMQWLHSHGKREPRRLHITKWDGKSDPKNPNGLDGLIFNIDDKPLIQRGYTTKTGKTYPDIYGYPSQLPNCGCVMVAVLDD